MELGLIKQGRINNGVMNPIFKPDGKTVVYEKQLDLDEILFELNLENFVEKRFFDFQCSYGMFSLKENNIMSFISNNKVITKNIDTGRKVGKILKHKHVEQFLHIECLDSEYTITRSRDSFIVWNSSFEIENEIYFNSSVKDMIHIPDSTADYLFYTQLNGYTIKRNIKTNEWKEFRTGSADRIFHVPNTDYILLIDGQTIQKWNWKTCERILSIQNKADDLVVLPGNEYILTKYRNIIQKINLSLGTCVRFFEPHGNEKIEKMLSIPNTPNKIISFGENESVSIWDISKKYDEPEITVIDATEDITEEKRYEYLSDQYQKLNQIMKCKNALDGELPLLEEKKEKEMEEEKKKIEELYEQQVLILKNKFAKKEENSNQRIIEKYKSKEQNIRKRKRGYDDSQKILDANIKKLKENHKSETEKHESEKEKKSVEESTTESTTCIICMSETMSCVSTSCGHAICCENCLPQVRHQLEKKPCPVCRKEVNSILRVYF